jgi:hypothetical protein
MKICRLGIVVLLATGAVLALSSCGGSGSNAKPLSKAELAAQANKICDQYSKTLSAIPAPTSQTDFPKALAQVAKLLEARAAELMKLTPPSKEKAAYQQYLKIGDQQIQRIRDLASAYTKGDTAKAKKITAAGNAVVNTANTLLGQLGANSCAQ